MKLGTLMYHDKELIETEITRLYATTNSLRQKRLLNGVSAHNLVMMGPLTMKLGCTDVM